MRLRIPALAPLPLLLAAAVAAPLPLAAQWDVQDGRIAGFQAASDRWVLGTYLSATASALPIGMTLGVASVTKPEHSLPGGSYVMVSLGTGALFATAVHVVRPDRRLDADLQAELASAPQAYRQAFLDAYDLRLKRRRTTAMGLGTATGLVGGWGLVVWGFYHALSSAGT